MSVCGSFRGLGAAACILFLAGTVKAAESISVVVTEQVFFAAYQGQTFSNFAETSRLSTEQKKSLIANLKGYSLLNERLPISTWTDGTSIITVGKGVTSFTIDFAEIEKDKIKINNKVVAIPRDAMISEVYSKIKAALSEKKSKKNSAGISDFFIKSAYAADDDMLTPQQLLKQAEDAEAKELKRQGFAATAYTVVAKNSLEYWKAQQQLTEGQKNAKAILVDLANSDGNAKVKDLTTAALMDFKCSQDVFYYTYQYNFIDSMGQPANEVHKVFIDHDKGKIKTVSTQQTHRSPNGPRHDNTCHYFYDPTKGNTYVTQDAESMKLRGIECKAPKGEVATAGTSIKRVESCCKDVECRGALQTAIRSGKNAQEASKAVINPQGNGGANGVQ